MDIYDSSGNLIGTQPDNAAATPQPDKGKMRNRLTREQQSAVITWIAGGLPNNEIIAEAGRFKEPFTISQQLINKYRKIKGKTITKLRQELDEAAIYDGFALKRNRMDKMESLANEIYDDLMVKKRLWLERKRSIGYGDAAEVITEIEFNGPAVIQFRGLMDDFAREMGHRAQKKDISVEGKVKGYTTVSPDDWDETPDAAEIKKKPGRKPKVIEGEVLS